MSCVGAGAIGFVRVGAGAGCTGAFSSTHVLLVTWSSSELVGVVRPDEIGGGGLGDCDG